MLKTMKYTWNLSTKLFLLQYDKNALTTFLHSTDDLFLCSYLHMRSCLTRVYTTFLHTGIAPDVTGYLWTGLNDIAEQGNYTWEDGSPVS